MELDPMHSLAHSLFWGVHVHAVIYKFECFISNLVLIIAVLISSCEIALSWMQHDLNDDKLT